MIKDDVAVSRHINRARILFLFFTDTGAHDERNTTLKKLEN